MNRVKHMLDRRQYAQLCALLGAPLLWVGLVCLVNVSVGRLPHLTLPLALGGFLAFAAGVVLLVEAISVRRPSRSAATPE